jgi:hypothetical protein
VLKLGGLALLAATTGLGSCGTDSALPDDLQLVTLFDTNRVIAAGRAQRLPVAVIRAGTLTTTGRGTATSRITRAGELIDTVEVVERAVATDTSTGDNADARSGVLRYFPIRTTLPVPGIYEIELDLAGVTLTAPVQAFDPSDIAVPLPGAAFPRITTPTITDPQGIDPLCSKADGPCPFHTESASEVLASGRPLVMLVTSPAYCQTLYCGPVLDVMIDVAPGHPGVSFIHVEPYANPRAVAGDLLSPELRPAPTTTELGLDFDPACFVVDASGALIERLDALFDRGELDDTLARLG